MTDLASQWLVDQIRSLHKDSSNQLWIVDENYTAQHDILPSLPITIICNRFDLADQLKQKFPNTVFSDFDFTKIESGTLDNVFYRISKEKAVTHHVINQAHRCLKTGGQFFVVGYKNEGIKTYLDKAGLLWEKKITPKKNGEIYTAVIRKQNLSGTLLDTSNYTELRSIGEYAPPILSKPGQFGWNKLDAGSQLLIDTLRTLKQRYSGSALDLGCGYGFLTLNAVPLPQTQDITEWTLTDNNAAALLSATANCTLHNISSRVIAADCAKEINQQFDLILCNPPFHQGFDTENSLTDKFLASAASHLKASGECLFVVNQFIPIERKALPYFSQVKLLKSDGKFKVISLSK